MKRLISFDWAIKRLLRNKANFGILEGFLSELITPGKDLKIVRLLDGESNKETKDNKFNRVDILVALETGEIVLIEVQVNRELDFLHWMLFGTSKVITEYLIEGEKYAHIKKVYSVNILYFDLGQGEDYIYRGTTDFVGVYNRDHLRLSSKQQALYQKELISEIYPEYFIIKVNNFNDLAKNSLDEWIYFLKNEEIKSSFHAKGLLEAKAKLDIMKLSDEDQAIYKRYQGDLHYQASMIGSSYDEGRLDGYGEGKLEGRLEGERVILEKMVISMLHQQISIEQIMQVTNLSASMIEALIVKHQR